MKKKVIAAFMAAAMMVTALTGCGGKDDGNSGTGRVILKAAMHRRMPRRNLLEIRLNTIRAQRSMKAKILP